MVFSSKDVRPDLKKVEALENLLPPKNRRIKIFYLHIKIIVILSKHQSDSNFIPNFSRNKAPLGELLNSEKHYRQTKTHQKDFNDNSFQKA